MFRVKLGCFNHGHPIPDFNRHEMPLSLHENHVIQPTPLYSLFKVYYEKPQKQIATKANSHKSK